MQDNKVTTHAWESWAGRAPYKFVTIVSVPGNGLAEANPTAYNNAMHEASQIAAGFGVHLCSCENCGQSLMNNCICCNADGKHFVVGLDCVRKVGDTQLITQAEKAEKKRQKALRDERNKIKWEKQREAREATLQSERDKNGGETDQEMATRIRHAEVASQRAVIAKSNEWLAEVLEAAQTPGGSFCESVASDLRSGRQAAAQLPGRCLDICRDIYAKQVSGGARRNSKAFDEAFDEFDEKIQASD